MNTNRTLTRLFLTCAFALSGTYSLGQAPAWEGYDDFSGASLNATKWDTAIFDGGNHPVVSDGQLLFTGNAPSGSSQSVATQRMLATNSNAASMLADGTEPHSVLEFKESDSLKGIELTLSLPSAVPQKMGFGLYAINYIAQFNATNEEEAERAIRFDIDLWYDSGNPVIEFQVKDPQTGVETDVKVPIQFDQSYRVGFVRDETTIKFYLNDELKGEFPYQNVGETFIVRAMNENGQSFSTSVNNVRVLRNWEDYDDFNDNSLDAAKWATGYWPGAQAPKETNGRIELSGTGINSGTKHPNFFNDLFSAGMPSNGTHHSILALQESEFLGIEAELTLPATNTFGSGVYLGIMEKINSTSIGFVGPELGLWGSTPSLSFENSVYENGNEVVDEDLDKVAALGQSYRVSIVKYGDKYRLYLDDELIKEYPVRGTTAYFHFAAFHDQDQPFTAYVDNVRVLRSGQTAPSLNVTSLSLRAFRDQVYLQGQNGVSVIAGAGEINFDLELADKPTVSAATLSVDGSSYNLANLEGPTGFRTTFGYSSHDNELFDVESSSASDWSSYLNGKTFSFSLTVDGHDYSYFHDLPAQSALPPIPNLSLSGTYQWKATASGGEYVEIAEDNGLTIDWGSFSSAGANDFITVSAEELIGDDETEVLANTYLSSTATSYKLPSGLFKAGKNYSFYVAFHKVTQSENPTGFIHQAGTDTSQPLLQTTARSVTALDIRPTLLQAETVVSTPDGKPVVVQVGDAYKWNSSLDGVTLWGVWEDEDDGWTAATIQYVNGKQKGNIGLYDQLTTNLIVDHPYVVDESGMIKVTEDTAYQYYQVTGVENGVIQTADDSVFPLSDTSWFFTTKAAAEEYYYSKVGHPNSKGWMWFDQYPWVYSHEEGNWLYFKPSGDKLLYYSVRDKAWREFVPKQP
jgi:hypothetical protein